MNISDKTQTCQALNRNNLFISSHDVYQKLTISSYQHKTHKSLVEIVKALSLLMKCDYAKNKNNQTFTVIDTYMLITMTGLCKKTILKWTKFLEQKGILQITRHKPQRIAKNIVRSAKTQYKIIHLNLLNFMASIGLKVLRKPKQNKKLHTNIIRRRFKIVNKGNFMKKFKLGNTIFEDKIVDPELFLNENLKNISFTIRQSQKNYKFTNEQVEAMIKPFVKRCIRKKEMSSKDLIKRFLGWVKARSLSFNNLSIESDVFNHKSMKSSPAAFQFIFEHYADFAVEKYIHSIIINNEKYKRLVNRFYLYDWMPSRDEIYKAMQFLSAKENRKITIKQYCYSLSNIIIKFKESTECH